MPGHIFISYARDDDGASAALGAKGLVASLHDRLLKSFKDMGSPQPTIFQDIKQIKSNEQFEERLTRALESARWIVVVLSRNWVKRPWCLRELAEFAAHWQRKGESDTAVKERIFVVHKHAIASSERPVWLQGQTGYALLEVDDENGEEIEYFNTDLGRPDSEKWFTATRELAKDLRRRAETEGMLPAAGALTPSLPPDPEEMPLEEDTLDLTVYIAPIARDMESSYAKLVAELKRRGARVVPEPGTAIPTEGIPARDMIDAALKVADVSIHLLGEKLGFRPDDAPPIVQFQLERAAARVDAPDPPGRPRFHRIIWAPRIVPGAADDASARDLFDVVARHSGLETQDDAKRALKPADKLDGDTPTKFIQFVLLHLAEVARPASAVRSVVRAGAQVYVQHDEHDAMVAEQVAEGLQRLGFAPMLPLIDGDVAGRQQVHRDSLKHVDAVVFCWALAAPVWVRAAARELRSWPDLGRRGAFAARIVISLPPPMADKIRLRKFPPRTDIDDVLDATAVVATDPAQLDAILGGLLGRFP